MTSGLRLRLSTKMFRHQGDTLDFQGVPLLKGPGRRKTVELDFEDEQIHSFACHPLGTTLCRGQRQQ